MMCPTLDQLVDYLEGVLEAGKKKEVSDHLTTGCQPCNAARAWYERLRTLISEDNSIDAPAWLVRRAIKLFDAHRSREPWQTTPRGIIAALSFDSLARPVAVGIRSADLPHRQLLYQAGDYSIDLQISAAGSTRADILGQVLREGESGFDSVMGVEVSLYKEGRQLWIGPTSQVGEFSIEGLERGGYEMKVIIEKEQILLPSIPVDVLV